MEITIHLRDGEYDAILKKRVADPSIDHRIALLRGYGVEDALEPRQRGRPSREDMERRVSLDGIFEEHDLRRRGAQSYAKLDQARDKTEFMESIHRDAEELRNERNQEYLTGTANGKKILRLGGSGGEPQQ